MTNRPPRTWKRSNPPLTAAARQAKHRAAHGVQLVAVKQSTLAVLRALRPVLGLSNDLLVLTGLQALLAQKGLRVVDQGSGDLRIEADKGSSKPKRHRSPEKPNSKSAVGTAELKTNNNLKPEPAGDRKAYGALDRAAAPPPPPRQGALDL